MSGDLRIAIATSRRTVGDGLAGACRRRGLDAAVLHPRGSLPDGVDVLVLDLSSDDGRVDNWASSLEGVSVPVVGLAGPSRKLSASVHVDAWVDAQEPIDRFVDVVRTASRSPEGTRNRPPRDGVGSSGTSNEPLTARERDVLCELLGGGGPAAMGARLGVSEHTVRTHLQNAMLKLGLGSRVEAAAWAKRHGLAPVVAEGRS